MVSDSFFNVSRETYEELKAFEGELLRWQKKINLISNRDAPCVWDRHIRDSLQLLGWVLPETREILDLGSGAGFPGIVLAIALKGRGGCTVRLVDSNHKKTAFLHHIARLFSLDVEVYTERISPKLLEKIGRVPDLITSRALCSLAQLIEYVEGLVGEKTKILALKGKGVDEELKQMACFKDFAYSRHNSLLPGGGCVIEVTLKKT